MPLAALPGAKLLKSLTNRFENSIPATFFIILPQQNPSKIPGCGVHGDKRLGAATL